MPELPEVETVKETLKRQILDKTIASIDVYYERIVRNLSAKTFISVLIGQKLLDIRRRGKYLFFHFDKDILVIHLRMEGKFFVKKINDPVDKHEHIIFHFTDGTDLRYHDVRKFGTMEIIHHGEELSAQGVSKLGFEPFDAGFTFDYLKTKIAPSKRPIKSILLDQTVIAGLGNIYVDEVLFLSKIDPRRLGNSITESELDSISVFSKRVLTKAIELGGSTIRSYVSSLGITGRFQNELKVHTKEGEPCLECGTLIKKTKVGGRGTYYCPTCQK